MKTKKSFDLIYVMEFLSLLAFVVIFLYIIAMASSRDNESVLSKYYYTNLDSGWKLYINGELQGSVALPYTVEGVTKNDDVYIEGTIPSVLKGGFYLSTRNCLQNLAFYFGDESSPRYEYIQEEAGIYRERIVDRYLFVELRADDVGQKVRIKGLAIEDGNRYFRKVIVGDKAGIISQYLKDNFVSLSFAVFYFFLGVLCLLLGIVLKFVFHNVIRVDFLGMALILITLWDFTQSQFRDLFFSNVKAISIAPTFILVALPIPVALFLNSLQKNRYILGYTVWTVLALLNALTRAVYQFLRIKDVFNNFYIVFIILFGLVFYILYTFYMDYKAGYLSEYKTITWGLYAVALAGFFQMVEFYHSPTSPDGIFLCTGFAILTLFSLVHVASVKAIETGERRANEIASDIRMRFLANMSHEIRTPINAMMGMNEAILRESMEENIQGYAADIDEAGRFLLTLINDILDYSKLESGKSELIMNEYGLKGLVINSAKYVSDLAKEKNLEINVDIDEQLPSSLYGDEIRIRQIICNLLNNAIKYTESGSVSLHVYGEKVEADKCVIHFQVADTGCGIPQEELGRLFKVFDKLDGKSVSSEGNGLGLAISNQLAQLMNGSIEVESIVGLGSKFTLTIPQQIIDGEPVGRITQDNMDEYAQKRADVDLFRALDGKILVVDDNLMNRRLVTILLARTGLQIDCVATGDEGIAMACSKKYDVILMDHVMPVKDGVETLNELKLNPDNLNGETPIIMLTANAIMGAREQYLEAGFTDYLSKPFRSEDIQRIILKYLPEDKVTRLYSRVEY